MSKSHRKCSKLQSPVPPPSYRKWIKLQSPPFKYFSKPLSVSNKELVILPIGLRDIDGIYKYDTYNNKWNKRRCYDGRYRSVFFDTIFDKNNHLLYVRDDQQRLVQININSERGNELISTEILNLCSRMIYIDNNKIHIISKKDEFVGGNYIHFIFDKKTKQFDEIYHFEYRFSNPYSSIYIKSRKTVLLFGIDVYSKHTSIILEYSLLSKKWTEWKQNIPNVLPFSTIVITKNDQYLIMFGGNNESIYVFLYDIKHNNFIKSTMKCPFKSISSSNLGTQVYATIICDEYHDQLLVFGFVNQCFNSIMFINIQPLPFHLIRLIASWVCYDNIHLFQRGSGDHCKISVDTIIQSINC